MKRVHLRRRGKTFHIDYCYEGKRHRHTLGTDDLRVAEEEAARLEYLVRSRTLSLPSKAPIEPFLAFYLAEARQRQHPRSFIQTRSHLAGFFDQARVRFLSDVRTHHISDFLVHLREDGRSPKTTNNYRATLHAFFAAAVTRGEITLNPVGAVKTFRVPVTQPRHLSSPDIDRLMEVTEGDIIHPLIATYIFAGLRRDEGIWLTLADLDFSRGLIHVRTKMVDGVRWIPKTARDRSVPISGRLHQILFRFKVRSGDGLWAFPSPKRCRWHPDNLSHRFRRMMEAEGLGWRIADLRRTFATHVAANNTPLLDVAMMMGNSPAIVGRYYAAAMPEHFHEAVNF